LPRLNRIRFNFCTIDPGVLKELTALKGELKDLGLRECSLGDGAVDAILQHRGLRTLNLGGTQLTDEGLMRLGKLPNLSTLDVRDADVTEEGIGQFSREHPGVQIRH